MLHRKTRSAKTYCDKLYINTIDLSVNGSHLEPISQTLPTTSSSKRIHIKPKSALPPRERHVREPTVKNTPQKKTINVNVVKVYKNNAACSERLREIYESVEVAEDFKRLLCIDEIANRPEKRVRGR